VIDAEDLAFLSADQQPASSFEAVDLLEGTLPQAVERVEREMIRRALAASAGNRAQAAERLGIRRQLLYQKLERYGLAASPNGTELVPDEDAKPQPTQEFL
jgi:two-component system NtrC family response regulator